jgi:hypothetical protein
MRNQLNKLVDLTDDLQFEIVRLNLPVNDKLEISDDIKVYTASNNDYIQASFSNFPNRVDVTIHKIRDTKYITANVSVMTLSDEDLDLIVMRAKIQIANFVKDLEATIEKRRVDQIAYHLKQIEELQGDVQNS